MQNGNRTFHEMNLFQGNWNNNEQNLKPSVSDVELEKVFEEIDHDLGTIQNESTNRTRPRGKSSGKPLILAPPKIKSIEERAGSSKSIILNEVDDILDSDESEEFNDATDYNFDFHESSEENPEAYAEESIEDEISSLEEESDESYLLYEDSDEEVDYEHVDYESSQDQPESNEDIFDEQEPMNLVPAAYRGMDYRTKGIKVRLPVHLADVDLELDIFDTFYLSRPIASVSKVDCSLHSIDVEVLLPSASLFTKGTLLLDIDYASANDCGTMHSMKIHIPWKKIIKVKWFHQPELSWKSSKEYMFTSSYGQDPGFHREFSESLTEKIDFQLSNLHCVWNEQFINNEKVLVQGTARMQIDLFQKQCVDLRSLL
jgi:hypothetical protein